MTNFTQYTWRLDLPDNWTPDGFWCVGITIPAGQQYMDALSAALGSLTLSKTWARDPTGLGAPTVAHTWENALYMNPFSVNQGCVVIAPPPIPNEAAAADWSAAIIQKVYQHWITSLNACATTPSDCAACVADIMAELAPYTTSSAVRGAISRLCADLNALTPTQRAAYATDCQYIPMFGELKTDINTHPFDWLNDLSDWLFGFLNTTSDAIINDLNTAGGLIGGAPLVSYVQDHGGSGGGAGFGSTCPWSHVLDFSVSDYGFYAPSYGHYVAGVGWQNGIDPGKEACFIQRDFPVHFQITDLSGTWNCAAPYASYQGADIAASGPSGVFLNERNDLIANTGGTLSAHVAAAECSTIYFAINIIRNDPQSILTETQMVVSGIGFDPFA